MRRAPLLVLAVLMGAPSPSREACASPADAAKPLANKSQPGPSANQAVTVKEWLSALLDHDAVKVARITRLPFRFLSNGRKTICERTASDAKGFADLIACFDKKETLFLQQLKYALEELEPTATDSQHAPKVLVDLLGRLDEKQKLVEAAIDGDGINYTMLFVLTPVDGKPAMVDALALKVRLAE